METLVLNATYEPVARVTWQRAISLLFSGKVEVVEEYDDKTIRSVTFEVRMPSVVRFLRMLKRRKPVIRFSRENVYARDHGKCQYCTRKITRAEATYDHVVPRAQGGRTGWDNIVIACVPCNQAKGGRTPEQARMKLIRVPARPRWTPFFRGAGKKASYREWLPFLSLADASYWNVELNEE